MQEEVVQSKIAQQEQFRAEQQKKKEQYMENIYNTLKPAELNGVKIDSKRQKFLWDELTTVKYELEDASKVSFELFNTSK